MAQDDEALWVTEFNQAIDDNGANMFEEYGPAFKRYLLSDSMSGPELTDLIQTIQDFGTKGLYERDPLAKFYEDKGMGGYLWETYQVILSLGRFLPHDDPAQDKLVNVLIELRKQPTRTIKIGTECELWTTEPYFGMTMADDWNGNHPTELDKQGKTGFTYKEKCRHWVNFSSFVARCIAADLLANTGSRCSWAMIDIREALEKPIQHELEREMKLTVAAKHVILAGNIVADEIFNKLDLDLLRQEWRDWTNALGQLAVEEQDNPQLAPLIQQAHERVKILTPAIPEKPTL